jgi:hypothetical protein
MAMAAVLVFGASLAARAAEAMDHAALAAQYEQEAKDARAKVTLHKDMEKQYEGVKVTNPKSGMPNLNTMKNHCRRLVNEYTQVANDADALAKEHRAAAAAAK